MEKTPSILDNLLTQNMGMEHLNEVLSLLNKDQIIKLIYEVSDLDLSQYTSDQIYLLSNIVFFLNNKVNDVSTNEYQLDLLNTLLQPINNELDIKEVTSSAIEDSFSAPPQSL